MYSTLYNYCSNFRAMHAYCMNKSIHIHQLKLLCLLWKKVKVKVALLCPTLWPHGLYSPWYSLGQNTRVGTLSLLQGIFPTQELNPGLLHCRWILYQLSHKESPNLHLFCFQFAFYILSEINFQDLYMIIIVIYINLSCHSIYYKFLSVAFGAFHNLTWSYFSTLSHNYSPGYVCYIKSKEAESPRLMKRRETQVLDTSYWKVILAWTSLWLHFLRLPQFPNYVFFVL